jgi:hypothetical protein
MHEIFHLVRASILDGDFVMSVQFFSIKQMFTTEWAAPVLMFGYLL